VHDLKSKQTDSVHFLIRHSEVIVYGTGEYADSLGPSNGGSEMRQARIYQKQAQHKGM